MSQLPQEVAKAVANLKPGEISEPFIMRDNRNAEVVAIVKLSKRVDAHRANLSDDYQAIKAMYEKATREKKLRAWLTKKIADTYVRIEPGWDKCEFQYDGWIKSRK